MLPDFDLFRPHTLPEALALLADHAPDAMPLAGGTNLIVELRDGQRHPAKLVEVGRLRELRGIRRDDGHIVVGGATTITELLADPLVAEHGRPLRQAAALLGNPLVRSRATIGGNLANASPAADTAPPLMALGAEVALVSRSGTRRLPLDEFMVDVNRTLIRPDELVAAVRWPLPPPRCTTGFYKIGLRKADACSVLNAAAMVICDGGGLCRQVRIAIGAAAPRPVRARRAEAALEGRPLDPRIIDEAARLAVEDTQPIDDIRGSAAYRRRMTEVIVRRLLARAAEAHEA